jgi:hypothetical protein
MIPIYVIDPENQIIRMANIEPSLDDICSLLNTKKVRVITRTNLGEKKTFTLAISNEAELSKHSFCIEGIHEEFHGNAVLTKLNNKAPVPSDLSLEEVRSLVTFLRIDGVELLHNRGLAWSSGI